MGGEGYRLSEHCDCEENRGHTSYADTNRDTIVHSYSRDSEEVVNREN